MEVVQKERGQSAGTAKLEQRRRGGPRGSRPEEAGRESSVIYPSKASIDAWGPVTQAETLWLGLHFLPPETVFPLNADSPVDVSAPPLRSGAKPRATFFARGAEPIGTSSRRRVPCQTTR